MKVLNAIFAIAPLKVWSLYVEHLGLSMGNNLATAHFQFNISQDEASGASEIFPLSLSELSDEMGVRYMKISFTRGQWLKQWGEIPIEPGIMGVQIDAELEHDAPSNSWMKLLSKLAGMFCASINLISHDGTLLPSHSKSNDTQFRGFLPGETVCTENITPWLKFLPCPGSAGLSSLLDPEHFFRSHYHQIDLMYTKNNLGAHITQNAFAIFDLKRFIVTDSKFLH